MKVTGALMLGLAALGCNPAMVRVIERDGGAANAGGVGSIGGAGGGSGGGPGPSPDGGRLIGNGPTEAERQKYCMGQGPAVAVPDQVGAECAGRVAQRLFRFGVCVCEGVSVGTIVTDSLDSRNATTPILAGAAVGVNGLYQVNFMGNIGGSLYLAADYDNHNVRGHEIHGDLKVNGKIATITPIHVTRDAWVGGKVLDEGAAGTTMTVDRDFYNPFAPDPRVMVKGRAHRQPVTVPPPCDCDPARLLDVSAAVDEAKTNNHNALMGMDPNRLAGLRQDAVVPLPCGRFSFTEISSTARLTLQINGRTAIYVNDFYVSGPALSLDVGPQGELDLFVRNSLVLIARNLSFGSKERPAATRVYVGAGAGIGLGTEGLLFAVNLYAPRASFVATTGKPFAMYGSLFTKSIVATTLELHYDRAINEAGRDCPDPGPPSGSCQLKSGACRSDADCCAPLVCWNNGRCSELFE